MQTLLAERIALTPRPLKRETRTCDVALIGHCPGRTRVARLLAMPELLAALESLGYRQSVRALRDGQRQNVHHLPLLLRSAADFHDIFPDAAVAPSAYYSRLAGDGAWLARAVDDFFANGGGTLWLVQVPDEGGSPAVFMPRPDTRLEAVESLRGLEAAMIIPQLAIVAMPDLERLQVPAWLDDIARVRLDNPRPMFRPCAQSLDDDHRERRHSSELPPAQSRWPLERILAPVLAALSVQRPDVQLLLTLPLAGSPDRGQALADPLALASLTRLAHSAALQTLASLRQVQFLFPYLRSAEHGLHSPTGAVSALQARVSREAGPWRSIADRPVRSAARPWPVLNHAEVLAMRESPGVGVLLQRDGRIVLDDERLCTSALAGGNPQLSAMRSGEMRRFIGFLQRQLQSLGDTLVFDIDPRDPQPAALLQAFFRKLHARGALRGALPEDGFRVTRSGLSDSDLRFDIEIAPAFPIDRIWLSFEHRDGRWVSEVGNV